MAKKRPQKRIDPPKQLALTSADDDEDDDEDEDDLSELPTEFRILKMGMNPAYHLSAGYQMVMCDSACMAQCMDFYKLSGMDYLSIDHEHQSFNAPRNGEPAPAHGWFKLEARPDGLYATDVKWTDSGKDLLTSKQYRYYSPAIEYDENMRVTRVHNVGLTNIPALQNLKPLMAANLQGVEMEPKILALLGVAADKAVEKIAELQKANEEGQKFKTALLSAVGKSTEAEAIGAIAAMKESNTALLARVAALESAAKDHEGQEIARLVDDAIKAGKVPPAKKDEVLGLYSQIGKPGIVSYLSILPVLPSQESQKPTQTPANAVLLTAAEKTVCEAFRMSPEDFIKAKQSVLNRRPVAEEE